MKSRWLSRDIAAPGPYLILFLEENQFHKELKKLGVNEEISFVSSTHSNATVHKLFSKEGNHCALVCLNKWESRSGIEIAGLLVHEAVHIWQEYCEYIGEDSPGSEQEAYAIQTISQILMWEFERLTSSKD